MRIAMTTASYSRACMMYITTHHDDLAGAKRLIGLYTIRFSLFYSYYIYLFRLLLLWWLIPIQWSRAHQEIIRSLACVKYIKEGEPLKFNRQFSDTSLFLSQRKEWAVHSQIAVRASTRRRKILNELCNHGDLTKYIGACLK